MNHPIVDITSNIDKPYYFGIGGIGDFLLLMASFYDGIEQDEVDVVFIANNMKPLRDLTSPADSSSPVQVELFHRVHRFWFFPRQAFPFSPELWEFLMKDPRCKGTGVTPKNFNYIGDWNECGKTNVFEYYGIQRLPIWARAWPTSALSARVTYQPFGGADDPTKIKRISDEELVRLVTEEFPAANTTIIGSKKEIGELQQLDFRFEEVEFVTDIKLAVSRIRTSSGFIGTDSWGKTMAKLAGVNHVHVYKNRYINATPQQMFGQDVDPGDCVFLHDWGFEFREES
jgi:hypothetical protein